MTWILPFVFSLALIGLTLLSSMLLLGGYFLREFTRPGVTLAPESPEWKALTFPKAAEAVSPVVQRPLTFQAADGTVLRGVFWAQASAAPTILISHGYHMPSVYFDTVASLVYAQGVNVFLFDYRGHGKSAPAPVTCGNAEVADLVAALEIAASQPEALRDRVYILGFSMGASVALLLPAHAPLAGIVADSAYARLDQVVYPVIRATLERLTANLRGPLRVVCSLLPWLAHLMLLGGYLLFYLRTRSTLLARPDRTIGRHRAPILLVHATHDPFTTISHAHALVKAAQAAGRRVQSYWTESQVHCGSYGHNPQDYLSLLKTFVLEEEAS